MLLYGCTIFIFSSIDWHLGCFHFWAIMCNTSVNPSAAAAKLPQSCTTLCDPIDSNPPGSAVPGILQARTLEWAAISFSNAWKWKVKVKSLSRAWLLVTPWTAAYQAPPSMGFSRQEYWSGVPLPSREYWPRDSQKLLLCLTDGEHKCKSYPEYTVPVNHD